MPNFIPSKKQAVSTIESIARTGTSLAGVGLGAAIGSQAGPVGSALGGLAGAGLTSMFLLKKKGMETEKKIVAVIGILNAVDVLLESAMGGGRGVIG